GARRAARPRDGQLGDPFERGQRAAVSRQGGHYAALLDSHAAARRTVFRRRRDGALLYYGNEWRLVAARERRLGRLGVARLSVIAREMNSRVARTPAVFVFTIERSCCCSFFLAPWRY